MRLRRLRAEQLENRMLLAADLSTIFSGSEWLSGASYPSTMSLHSSELLEDASVDDDYFPDNRPESDDNDETNWTLRLDADSLSSLLALSTPAVIGRFTSQSLSFTTLANGMPVLNSLVGSPTSVFLDFDGDTTTSTDAYDVDGNPSTFNVAEQNTIAESWRHIATYFAMFDTNVTTTLPATGHPKVWAAIGNNIVGGYCFVNTFPNNTQPRCFNNSGDARTRNSGIAHEVGHNFGLQHQSDFDLLGGETADYSSGYDELHVPIMGVDFAQRVRKFVIGHTSNASGLQDDVNVIRNKIVPYQASGGDGFRADDFGGTIATATALTSLNDVQYASGIIERLADVDVFSFNSNGQTITVSALADFPSGVDLKLEIYDALGVLVAAKDAPTLNDQEITLVLPSGTYYASVSSHGNYGDLGTYNLAVRSLPTGWTQGDIGVVGVTGFSQFHSSTNSFVLGASGADIGGSTDEMQFARQTLTGNGTIIARVTSLVNTTGNAKAGIEIRESLAGNAKHVSLTPTPTGGVKFIRRSTTGGTSTTTSSAAAAFAPVWVRLQRVGDVFTASTSPNGTTWTTLGTATVAMNASVQIGLVATAQNDRLFTAAEFENVSITGTLGGTTPTPNSLPAPTGVVVTRGTGADLSISWANQASETGYRIERSIDGVVFTTAGTTATDVTTFVDTGLVGTMRYFYQVRALDASGASIPSVIVNALNRPSAVGNLELTSYSMTEIVLDWIETSGETGYRIERSPDGVTYTTIATVGAQIPSYTNSGLTAGTAYFYRVTPTSALGDGPSTVISGGTRLAAVTNLAFSSVLGNAASLTWTDLTTETGYQVQRSTNGTTFTQLTTLPAGTIAYTDNTVTAGNEYYYRVLGTLGQSVSLFNLAFTGTPTITALPSPWISQDIGTVSGGGVGSTTYSGTTFKVVSSGSTIGGGTTDSFRFTHQTLTGDGVITARVASLEDSGGTNTRFGVMFRETLNNNSRYAMMALREGNTGTAQFSSRAAVGTSAAVANDVVRNAPYWVRVTRAGNVFTGFTSSDGTTWTQIGQATINMPSTLFVGLAASSGITTLLNTATATNVSVLANPLLAITSTNRVYNNAPYAATASITNNNAPLPTLSFVYYSDAAGTTVIPAPTNVGTYYVRASTAANAGNFAAQSAISVFEITPFALTVSALGQSKVYDGNLSASVTLSDNRFSGDILTVTASSAFSNKNVGLAKPISVTGISLSGADAVNYTFNASTSTTANIDAKVLTASGSAVNKIYDGNTNAIVTISLIGIVGSESVAGTALGTFDNKNAGSAKTVSIGVVSLSGADSSNYSVGVPGTTTASITAKQIVGNITAANKDFDGATNATILTRSLVGAISGDDVNYNGGTATFDTADVGINKLVTAVGLSLTGADSSNYSVNSTATATAAITQPIATIFSRHLFYNNATGANLSSFGAANNAIASDKAPLLPGETSTFANYTNYSRGLNGIIVDINNLPATTTDSQILASFQFARWNGIEAGGFTALPETAIPSATILAGNGFSGSTRVKITFPDNTLQNSWLRITVVSNAQTALATDDVFYFGNVIGELNLGNTTTRLRVNGQDTNQVLLNQSAGANSAPIANMYDLNRDGRVNGQDTNILLTNQQAGGIVAPITVPPVLEAGISPSLNRSPVDGLKMVQSFSTPSPATSPILTESHSPEHGIVSSVTTEAVSKRTSSHEEIHRSKNNRVADGIASHETKKPAKKMADVQELDLFFATFPR